MPGIYINDGGGLQQSLGNILGGMATNLGPEAAARAQALQYETESRDIANQKAAEALQAQEWATNQGGGALGQAGAVPSVGGTVASLSAPPGPPPLVGGLRHPAGTVLSTNPYVAQVQNWIQSGQATPDAWKNDIVPLGQTMTTGPGSDYTTQTEVAKAREMPVTVSSGTTRVQDPTKPATGSNVIEGPDSATIAAQTKALEDTTTEAHAAFGRGRQAISDQSELQDIVKGYDALVNIPDGDLSTPAGLELLKAATDATGGKFDFTRFSSKQEAINDLTARLQGMLGSARVAQGDPALRGGIDVMLKQLDVAKNASPSFHRMTDAFNRQLQVLIDEGSASKKFLDGGPNAATATALRNQIIANRTAAAEELRKQGFSAEAQPPDQANPPPVAVNPQQELVYARDALNQGRKREDIIARAKERGVDLVKMGF